MYTIINWFGSEPSFSTDEDGKLLIWSNESDANLFAMENFQSGWWSIVKVPRTFSR